MDRLSYIVIFFWNVYGLRNICGEANLLEVASRMASNMCHMYTVKAKTFSKFSDIQMVIWIN